MKNEILKNNKASFLNENAAVLIFLMVAITAPFFLLPLEQFLGLDVLIEELFKLISIFTLSFFMRNKPFLLTAIFFGLFFSLTENILYLNNFIISGSLSHFGERLVLTSLLHVGTSFVVAISILKTKYLFVFAVVFNLIVHCLFNSWILLERNIS